MDRTVCISAELYCIQRDLNFGITSFGTRCMYVHHIVSRVCNTSVVVVVVVVVVVRTQASLLRQTVRDLSRFVV